MIFPKAEFAELLKMLTTSGKMSCAFCGLMFWFRRGLELRVCFFSFAQGFFAESFFDLGSVIFLFCFSFAVFLFFTSNYVYSVNAA